MPILNSIQDPAGYCDRAMLLNIRLFSYVLLIGPACCVLAQPATSGEVYVELERALPRIYMEIRLYEAGLVRDVHEAIREGRNRRRGLV